MALGGNEAACQQAFVDAMRARLNALNPPAGANVDREDVKANLNALGSAAYDIVAHRSETHSDAAQDAAFWNWVTALSAWASAMSTWEIGLGTAFAAWAAATAPDLALKAAVAALPQPGPLPAVPASLTGKIQ